MHDGDVFIHNDPYFGGSHLPDVNVVRPAFHEGRLLGYACLRAHWPDIGSATPGSYGAVTEIYGEGLRLPPLRLVSRGALNVDLEKVILANVRTPDERKGDLGAQLAATLRATERLQELARRYGTDELIGAMSEVMDYSERLMRAMLADLPDGEGTFEDFCDGDGIPDDAEGKDAPFWIRMRVKKIGRPPDGRLLGQRSRRQGPDQRASVGYSIGSVLRPQDRRRPQQPHPPQFWVLAHHRGESAQRARWCNAAVSIARRLCQPRDLTPRRRHGDGRAGVHMADPGDGVQPGYLGRHHVRRRRSALGPTLRLLRDYQRRLRRAPQQGRHQCRRLEHLQHHEYAGRGAGDGVSAPRRALRDQSELRRRRTISRRLRRAAHVAARSTGANAVGSLCMERMTSAPFGLLGGRPGAAAVVTLTTPDGASPQLAEQRRIQCAGRLASST